MTLNVSKTKFSSTLDTFKNSYTVTQTFSVSAHTFSDGNSQLLTYNIPITHAEEFSQIKVNLSYDSSKWHLAPLLRFNKYAPSASTSLQLFANYTSSNLVIVVKITPVGSSPWSYSAFTFTVTARVFITPS